MTTTVLRHKTLAAMCQDLSHDCQPSELDVIKISVVGRKMSMSGGSTFGNAFFEWVKSGSVATCVPPVFNLSSTCQPPVNLVFGPRTRYNPCPSKDLHGGIRFPKLDVVGSNRIARHRGADWNPRSHSSAIQTRRTALCTMLGPCWAD